MATIPLKVLPVALQKTSEFWHYLFRSHIGKNAYADHVKSIGCVYIFADTGLKDVPNFPGNIIKII